ncbi:DEAD/DEAH box helicase [Paenibacillus agilis]|uniref:Helicase SNF n=1 Tax=Paenibacillus agilis TaxID=3020863 RepID=A0A559IWM7_9BACL|nr:DEAD/DEAH box helicase [Paenibacillus agilis]TVX92023.1 helicase SNF [Paenibacillus agilis]
MFNQLESYSDVEDICGRTSYRRGLKYYLSRRIVEFKQITEHLYAALVRGNEDYSVQVRLPTVKEVEASCTCPASNTYFPYCKHIAAVMLAVCDSRFDKKTADQYLPSALQNRYSATISSKDTALTRNMISIFSSQAYQSASQDDYDAYEDDDYARETLQVEWICHAVSHARRSYFALEFRIGPQRLYIVPKVREFLTAFAQAQPFAFSKKFTYSPDQYRFTAQDEAIIRKLIDIVRIEESYYDLMYGLNSSGRLGTERTIVIPPHMWEETIPLLLQVPIRIEQDTKQYDLRLGEQGKVPLSFRIKQDETDIYELAIEGLQTAVPMEQYGYICAEGMLCPVSDLQLDQFTALKKLFYMSRSNEVRISANELPAFIERALPGIKALGQVAIAPEIADKIVSPSLITKIYIDKSDNNLSVLVEFLYDDKVIYPFQPEQLSTDQDVERYVLRSYEQENEIVRILEQSGLRNNGKQLYTNDEEAIYSFLYHLLPKLEPIAQIYSTEAVKSLMFQAPQQPRAMLDMDTATDWLEVKFDMAGIEQDDIHDILFSILEKRKYYRLPSGAFVSLEQESYRQFGDLMHEVGMSRSEVQQDRIFLPITRGLSLIETGDDYRARGVKFGKQFRQMLDHMKSPEDLEFEVPAPLENVLRDYQTYGFHWLKTLSYYRFGGILADDMGLGKTLQSIAYIVSEREALSQQQTETNKPVLVVAPASLVYNWRNELHKFAPQLRVELAAGLKDERSQVIESLDEVDVLITSYPSLRRDIHLYENIVFSILLLDEAQTIKNEATQASKAVRQITASRRFALTGTPIENSVEEVWAIFEAVFPGLFTSKKSFQALSREELARKVRPFILRRLKQDVLKELPDKIETLHMTELSLDQKKLYLAYLSRLQEETLEVLAAEGFQKGRMKILAGITRLRQLCCHPSLFIQEYEGTSGKLEQLLELVDECMSSGKRMLIFSQFTSMLTLIRSELEASGRPVFYLDGKTPPSERVELCQRFNEGERDIFLISLRAGGTGLNLTGADTVVLYDLWWNPAVEQQAADRAHRIGQKNVVQVIRLVTHGTIEEKIYELQQRKKDLIHEVIQPGEETMSAITEQEIREILSIN